MVTYSRFSSVTIRSTVIGGEAGAAVVVVAGAVVLGLPSSVVVDCGWVVVVVVGKTASSILSPLRIVPPPGRANDLLDST
jgi:hypothetical protein